MNFDAWQTVWICVACSGLVLTVDALFASRAGPDKTDLARKGERNRRMAQLAKEKSE